MKKHKSRICGVLVILLAFLCAGCGNKPAAAPETTAAPVETTLPMETEPQRTEMATPDLAEYVQNRTVTITATMEDGSTSVGSGFFIDDMGTVATSYHVIDAANEISVEVSDGGKYDVRKIMDVSEIYDIAVIKIDMEGNPYLKRCEEKIRTGEAVYAVGSSLGFLNGTFSDGMISNAVRNVGIIECVQTTAAISEGNSGGPLVNAYGEVIGINAFSYQGGENLNLAVRIETLDELDMDKDWSMNQFREWYKKEISRSYKVWNYTTKEWELSKINTYQQITGRTCDMSYYSWDFLDGYTPDKKEGYHDSYGVFQYEYDVEEFDKYTEYLNSIGFYFSESEEFSEGTSYYYENEFTGHCMDIFIMAGDKNIVLEPYCN